MTSKETVLAACSVLVGLFVGAILAELSLRGLARSGVMGEDWGFLHYLAAAEQERSIYRFSEDPTIVYELVPDSRRGHIRVNRDGFRGPEYPRRAAAGVTRIAFLGDSATFGALLREDETIPGQLERELGERGAGRRFEVLNFGVPGYNTVQEHRVLTTRAVHFEPDVVIVYHVFNDPIPKGAATVIEPSLLNRSHLFLFSKWLVQTHVVWFNKELRQHRRGDKAELYLSLYASDAFDAVRERILSMADFLSERDVRFLLVIAPEVKYYEDYADYPFHDIHEKLHALASPGIEVVDPLGALAASGRSPLEFWVTPTDNHPNGEANAIIAGVIASQLLAPAQARSIP